MQSQSQHHNSLFGWGLSCASGWGRDKIKAQALSRAKMAAEGRPRVKITSLQGLEQKSWPSIGPKQQSPPEVVPEPKNSLPKMDWNKSHGQRWGPEPTLLPRLLWHSLPEHGPEPNLSWRQVVAQDTAGTEVTAKYWARAEIMPRNATEMKPQTDVGLQPQPQPAIQP